MNIDDINMEKRVLNDLKKNETVESRSEKKAFRIINRALDRKLKAIKRKERELEKEKERRTFFSKL